MTAATVTVSGNVATNVKREEKTDTGEPWCHFRIACNERYFDNRNDRWVDGEPSFYTVVCWHPLLARNALVSLKKGEPIVVHGRMRVRDWRDEKHVQRYSMEITASSIGHDLYRGVTAFRRAHRQASIEAESEEVKGKLAAYSLGDDGVDKATGEISPRPTAASADASGDGTGASTEDGKPVTEASASAGTPAWAVPFSDATAAGAAKDEPDPREDDGDSDDFDEDKELVEAATAG
ncbi:single-stranded DNA-binding protein [Phytoactinopolyspora endophytica]|uniref:single-stranded DNA-binding protein n=1 Tax=Phytoactinopolyspora endophytica TaxID=1642495 RepID=UPI0013EA1D4C|nr:single-stranded DNA-binding protein [Phytoactinopolyspora endophytica]